MEHSPFSCLDSTFPQDNIRNERKRKMELHPKIKLGYCHV